MIIRAPPVDQYTVHLGITKPELSSLIRNRYRKLHGDLIIQDCQNSSDIYLELKNGGTKADLGGDQRISNRRGQEIAVSLQC